MSRKGKIFFSVLLLIMLFSTYFIFSSTEKAFGLLDTFTPKEVDLFARNYISLIQQGELKNADDLLVREIKNTDSISKLNDISKYITSEEPLSNELMGFKVIKSKNKTRNNLSYQLRMKDKIIIINIVVDETDNIKQVYGIQAQEIPSPLEEINKMTFYSKSVIHYMVLIVSIAVILYTFYIASVCFDMNIKRKWIWIIFILSGIGGFTFNWTNGYTEFNLLSIHIPAASVAKASFYAPWIFLIYIPIGAIIFQYKIYKDRRKIEETNIIEKSQEIDTTQLINGNDESKVQ